MAPANACFDPIPADDEYAGPQHVLDLPQLYSKPSAQSLLLALTLLTVAPSSWAQKACEVKQAPSISEDGVPSYLTRIVSSPLAWIPSDTDREEVWEAASRRLAERSGRTAMPSVSRVFRIPRSPQDDSETVDINLYEPSLTGDNLGHKTWVASYLLAKRLPTLLPRLFPGIKTSSETARDLALIPHHHNHPSCTTTAPRPHILELGAGTGLVGLAASALFATITHLTDLPSILPNLQHNITRNAPLTTSSVVTAAPLDWSSYPDSYSLPSSNNNNNNNSNDNNNNTNNNNNNNNNDTTTSPSEKFDLILAADSLYAPLHPKWLIRVIESLLKRDDEDGRKACVVMELPFRSEEPAEHEELRSRMLEAGFEIVEDGTEVGFEDWEDLRAGGGQLEVRCWWCVWRWR